MKRITCVSDKGVRGKIHLPWIVIVIILAVLVAAYVWLFLYTRKRQKRFDEQYTSAKERHEIFVLNKKIVKERAQSGWMRFARFKTYQVTGRINVSQAVRGIQMSRMQTMTFHTTKSEYDKIQANHKYKMDIAGNYIGYVHAPVQTKQPKPARNKDKPKDAKSGKAAKADARSKSGNRTK